MQKYVSDIKKCIEAIKCDPRKLFYVFCLLGFGVYIIANMVQGSDVMRWMVQQNNPDIRFIDYFMHIHYAKDPSQLYASMWNDTQGCFPALSYVMYRFFYKLVSVEGYVPPKRGDTEAMSGAYLVYVYYTLTVTLLIFTAICLFNKNKNLGKSVLIYICLMVSCPFMGSGFMVGNSTMLVLGMLMMSLALRDSESKVVREIALILLALAAGFKIYPAVFGLLYLKEKRWKEAIRLTIYGIVVFTVPFAFFGGIEGVKLWLGHIKGTMGMLEYGRVEYVKGVTYTILCKLGMDGASKVVSLICSLVPSVFLVIMIGLATVSKSKLRTVLFLVAAITFYPTNAFRYTLSYFAIPLVMWLQQEHPDWNKGNKAEKWWMSVLYGFVFSIPMLLCFFNLKLEIFTITDNISTSVDWWIYPMAYLLLVVEMVYQISDLKAKKEV